MRFTDPADDPADATPGTGLQEILEDRSALDVARDRARAAALAVGRRRAVLRPRHRSADYFPDEPDLDVQIAAVIVFVARYRDVDLHIRVADADDVLTMLAYQRLREEHLRLAAISTLRSSGYTWQMVAHTMGLASPQAAEQQYRRLTSAVAGGPRNERAARAADRTAATRRQQAETHEQRLRRLAGVLADRVLKGELPPAALDDSAISADVWAAEVAGLPDGAALTSLAVSELRWFAGELVGRDDVDAQAMAVAGECAELLA